MADTELKQISSGPADVIVEVEEEAPLSKDDVSSYVCSYTVNYIITVQQ